MPKRDAADKGKDKFYVGDGDDLGIFARVLFALLFTPFAIFQMLFVPKLLPMERMLMDAVLEHMSAEDQKRLKIQLWEHNINSREGSVNAPENVFQQWWLVIMANYSFRPFIDAPGHFVLLATVKFLLDGKEVTFDLFSLGGVLCFLQFNRNINERRTDIEIVGVDTEPAVLDEHGKFLRFAREG